MQISLVIKEILLGNSRILAKALGRKALLVIRKILFRNSLYPDVHGKGIVAVTGKEQYAGGNLRTHSLYFAQIFKPLGGIIKSQKPLYIYLTRGDLFAGVIYVFCSESYISS